MEINQNSAVTSQKRETLTDVKLKQNVKVNRVGNGVVDRCVGYPRSSVVTYAKASRQVWENLRNNYTLNFGE